MVFNKKWVSGDWNNIKDLKQLRVYTLHGFSEPGKREGKKYRNYGLRFVTLLCWIFHLPYLMLLRSGEDTPEGLSNPYPIYPEGAKQSLFSFGAGGTYL